MVTIIYKWPESVTFCNISSHLPRMMDPLLEELLVTADDEIVINLFGEIDRESITLFNGVN